MRSLKIFFVLNCFLAININFLYCQLWSEPENIYENIMLSPLELSVSSDIYSNFYFAFTQRVKNSSQKDTLYYFIQHGNSISDIFSFERSMHILDINLSVGNQEAFLMWGEGSDPNKGIISAYFTQISENGWKEPVLVQSFDTSQTKPTHINLAPLANSNFIVYWQIDNPSGIWFLYKENDSFGTPFLPFPEYSENLKTGAAGLSFYPNIVTKGNGKIYVSFSGVSSNNIYEGRLLYAENFFINKDWNNTIAIIDKSLTESYHFPQIAVTDEDIRYVIWSFDKNSDYWPDEIAYSYSYDGLNWSHPIMITHDIGDFTSDLYIQPDQSGRINIIWQHWTPNENGILRNKYYYATINRDSISYFGELPFMNYAHSPHSLNFIINNNNAHIFWVEFINKPTSKNYKGVVIKHVWRQLPTSVKKNMTKFHKNFHSFVMIKSFPNPFNYFTIIKYQLYRQSQYVKLSIFNTLGENVKVLIEKIQDRGTYSIIWKGNDSYGNSLPSGIYFLMVEINGKIAEIKKVIYLK